MGAGALPDPKSTESLWKRLCSLLSRAQRLPARRGGRQQPWPAQRGCEEAGSPPGPLSVAQMPSGGERSTEERGGCLWEWLRDGEGIASFFLPSLPTPQTADEKEDGLRWDFFPGLSQVSESSAKGKMAKTSKVSIWLQSLTGMAVPHAAPLPQGLASQTTIPEGAAQAPVLVMVQLQSGEIRYTEGNTGFTSPNYTSHQALAQHFQIKCGVAFSWNFSILTKKTTYFFISIYLRDKFFQEKHICFTSKNLFS